jgi:hypothetical protein
MNRRFVVVMLLGIITMGGLSACGSSQTTTGTAPPPSTVTVTPAPPPTIVLPNGVHGITLTMKDDRRQVVVKQGDVILLALDDAFFAKWTIAVADPTILAPFTEVTLPPHSQALYKAIKVGLTTIRAKGEPRCYQGNPPCQIDPSPVIIQIRVQ